MSASEIGDRTRQHREYRDKDADPAGRHEYLAAAEHGPQGLPGAFAGRYEYADAASESLQVSWQSVEVGGHAGGADGGHRDTVFAHFLGEGPREVFQVVFAGAVKGQSGQRHPDRVG